MSISRCCLALLVPLLLAASGIGCAGRREPATPAAGQPPQTAKRSSLRDLCQERRPEDPALLDESRIVLEETFCGATLWFDGLFGGQPDVANARSVSGLVELSTIYTDADGAQPKARLRLSYDLPNLEHRVKLFIGRDERDDFVRDRQEGAALRSAETSRVPGENDGWLAGLRYSLPGRWAERIDFRIGGRLSTAPEAFVQGRLRQDLFPGEKSAWRFKETTFYENRQGFGLTSSADFDHVLRRTLIFHWGSVGTISESTKGVDGRTTALLYQSLGSRSSLSYELFLRGSTDDDVPLREYGARGVYRRPLNRQWLYGDLIAGYTWPRESLDEQRKGSPMIGFGVELLFGRNWFSFADDRP